MVGKISSELSALLLAEGCQGRVRHAMVSNTEVVIALGMPDTVHYWSHVDGDHTSKYQELIGEVRDWKNLGLGRYTSDDDDKDAEIFDRMRCCGRNQDGLIKGNGGPRPTALVVIRCRISVARLIIGEKVFIQLGRPSIPRFAPRQRFLPEILHKINW